MRGGRWGKGLGPCGGLEQGSPRGTPNGPLLQPALEEGSSKDQGQALPPYILAETLIPAPTLESGKCILGGRAARLLLSPASRQCHCFMEGGQGQISGQVRSGRVRGQHPVCRVPWVPWAMPFTARVHPTALWDTPVKAGEPDARAGGGVGRACGLGLLLVYL